MSDIDIKPFNIFIADSALLDLKQRLKGTRWPEKEPVSDESQGVPLSVVQGLCEYWHDEYDWRSCETWINDAGSFKAEIDGYDIHFLHIRSPHAEALPMLLLHGWPGSILEFRKVIGPLSDPVAHGGDAKDAFHLIIPSMPGYGFSSKPHAAGTNIKRMSQIYLRLMEALGYTTWVAQGGDFGADVCAALAAEENRPPDSLLGVHLNCLYFDVDKELASTSNPTEEEKHAFALSQTFATDGTGYFHQQATRPQTVGYALADSPAGQAAWIYEKLQAWTHNDGDVQRLLTRDEILDNITLYWLTNTGASSARLYWEEKKDTTALKITIPIGVTQFTGEHYFVPRKWADRYYADLIHWEISDQGGHFAAWEVPDIFVREVRQCFEKVRN